MPFTDMIRQASADVHSYGPALTFRGTDARLMLESSVDQWSEMDFTTSEPTTFIKQEFLPQALPVSVASIEDDLTFLISNSPDQPSKLDPARVPPNPNLPYSGPYFQHNMGAVLPQRQPPELKSYSSSYNSQNMSYQFSSSPSLASTTTVSSLGGVNTEKLCPLLAGQIDSCQPSKCGPDAPCMNFTELPPIEECASVPCLVNSANQDESWKESHSSMKRMRPGYQYTRRPQKPSLSSSSSASSPMFGTPQVQQASIVSTEKSARQPQLVEQQNKQASAAVPGGKQTSQPVATTPKSKTKASAKAKVKARAKAKKAHSLVERKYRENLNAKIAQLWHLLQTTQHVPVSQESTSSSGNRKINLARGNEDEADEADDDETESNNPTIESSNSVLKVRKSDVLVQAMTYVHRTEDKMRRMEEELQKMNEYLCALEKIVSERGV